MGAAHTPLGRRPGDGGGPRGRARAPTPQEISIRITISAGKRGRLRGTARNYFQVNVHLGLASQELGWGQDARSGSGTNVLKCPLPGPVLNRKIVKCSPTGRQQHAPQNAAPRSALSTTPPSALRPAGSRLREALLLPAGPARGPPPPTPSSDRASAAGGKHPVSNEDHRNCVCPTTWSLVSTQLGSGRGVPQAHSRPGAS